MKIIYKDGHVAECPAEEELHVLRGLDRNARMIKGQVFLWPGADSWLDLWDVDGTIPGRNP